MFPSGCRKLPHSVCGVTELLHDYFTATDTDNALQQSDIGEGEETEQAVAVPENGTWTRIRASGR